MHKFYTEYLKKATLVAFFILGTIVVKAQGSNPILVDFENFLTDMVLISNNYVSPAADATVYQSTASWHSSARSLELWEADFSVHVNVFSASENDRSFTVRDSDFISLDIRDASEAQVPTALGGEQRVFYDFMIGDDALELQTFEGVDRGTLYYPYIQGSIGLWKETELTVQFIPEIEIDRSGYQTFGGALKHNISQYWLGANRDDDNLEFAVQFAYSKFDSKIFFNDFVIESSNPEPGETPAAIIQNLNIDADSYTSMLIASKRYDNLEVLGSFAVAVNQFDYTMGGEGEIYITLLNQAFTALEDANTLVKGNLGANYYFGDFYVASTVAVGKFLNVNVSGHYRF